MSGHQRFVGTVALVTGAGSGIGQETCVAFAEEGASIVAVDISSDGLRDTADRIAPLGAPIEALTVDITDERGLASCFERAVSRFGRIDCAVNNAGIPQSGALTHELESAEWRRILDVNVTGMWLCMREELRVMLTQGGGTIVNTASMMSFTSLVSQTAYATSKHAVMGLTKGAALEYAERGIRINAVAPGGIPTAMMSTSVAVLPTEQREAAVAGLAALHPMKRLGTPREIANAVLFLSSDQSGFTTGACLRVDGGWAAL